MLMLLDHFDSVLLHVLLLLTCHHQYRAVIPGRRAYARFGFSNQAKLLWNTIPNIYHFPYS